MLEWGCVSRPLALSSPASYIQVVPDGRRCRVVLVVYSRFGRLVWGDWFDNFCHILKYIKGRDSLLLAFFPVFGAADPIMPNRAATPAPGAPGASAVSGNIPPKGKGAPSAQGGGGGGSAGQHHPTTILGAPPARPPGGGTGSFAPPPSDTPLPPRQPGPLRGKDGVSSAPSLQAGDSTAPPDTGAQLRNPASSPSLPSDSSPGQGDDLVEGEAAVVETEDGENPAVKGVGGEGIASPTPPLHAH